MKDPGYFCENANPSGKCCFVDINAFIKFFFYRTKNKQFILFKSGNNKKLLLPIETLL
jgi:hypothetical protein